MKKKKSAYKKSLLIWFLILLVLSSFCWVYVYNTMKAYEKGTVEGYLNYVLEDMKESSKSGNAKKYFEIIKVTNNYEKNASLEKGYKELLSSSKLSYKEVKDKENTYDLYADDYVFARITINSKESVQRLGLLKYNVWETKTVESYAKEGFYDYDIYANTSYKVYINGIEAKKEDLMESSKIESLEEAYDYVDLPKLNHYEIKGLTSKPKIEIKDSKGKKVTPQIEGTKVTANEYFTTDDMKEANKKLDHEYDPLTFAENWSMFMTAEYYDEPARGLYKVSPSLIEGTKMYTKARNWATNVDITFTSVHTLDKVPFTAEKVSNIVVYNKNAFSADVYLEKNMTLNDGQKRKDVLNERIYFIYYDNAYRVIAMKSL